jgi:hypothetical protein
VVLVRQLAELDLGETQFTHGAASLLDIGQSRRVEEDADICQ